MDLAIEADVSEKTIYLIESGNVNVQLKTLSNVADALGVAPKTMIE